MLQLDGNHTIQLPWEGLCQGTGEDKIRYSVGGTSGVWDILPIIANHLVPVPLQ